MEMVLTCMFVDLISQRALALLNTPHSAVPWFLEVVSQ